MKIKLKVDGMSCSHCENAVKNSVGQVKGVTSVEVSLADKIVIVTGDNLDLGEIKETIDEQGYDVLGDETIG